MAVPPAAVVSRTGAGETAVTVADALLSQQGPVVAPTQERCGPQ